MSYFPKSQIKTDLFTNGNEYVISSTQEEYKGPYYEISSGKKYTGKNPQDGPNFLLTPILVPFNPSEPSKPSDINFGGEILLNKINEPYDFSYQLRRLPSFTPTLPTDKDKQNGQFIRYFCSKTNELKYFEIDKTTYDKLTNQDKQIAWDLYIPASLTWRIKGTQEQVFNSNKGAAISLERNLKWSGFSQYFRDKFLQYYLES